MEDKIQQFKQLVEESNNIVFFGEQEYPQKVEFQTLEVKMDYITKNMIIHQKKY